jgi:hypothetical protein
MCDLGNTYLHAGTVRVFTMDSAVLGLPVLARCAFSDTALLWRMPLVPMPARLKLLQSRYQ